MEKVNLDRLNVCAMERKQRSKGWIYYGGDDDDDDDEDKDHCDKDIDPFVIVTT